MKELVLRYNGDFSLYTVVKNSLDREMEIVTRALEKTKNRLKEYEDRYGVASQDFYSRMEQGKLDDRDDYVDWAGEYEIFLSLTQELKALQELKIEDR